MIRPLTSLRFVFAFMVFTSHINFLIKKESTVFNWLYDHIFYEGYIGVSFFFILSGFILAYTYQDKLLTKKKSIFQFFKARFARIYPLHLLTFIIAVPLSIDVFLDNKKLWLFQALSNLSLTQSFIPLKSIYFSFNIPSWSISDEMFFYILFPLLIILITKFLRFKVCLFAAIFILIPMLILLIHEDFYHSLYYVSPFLRVNDFIIGILLYNIYKTIKTTELKINFSWMEFLSVFLLIAFFAFHQFMPQVIRYSIYYWIPMSVLILTFSFQKGLLSKILSNKYFFYLGEISFGFYMFHLLILRYFSVINERYIHVDNEYIIISICLILTVIISHYSFKFYENPVNQYIKSIKYSPSLDNYTSNIS